VRGLAYYTGVVFEVFDAGKSLRSVAGGGRYDSLLSIITDGSTDLAATGYAMGDCVIAELIDETPQALLQFQAWRQRQSTCDVYVIIADEARRPEALKLVSDLRNAGLATDYPLGPAKINKQFKAADATLARLALVVGSEFPELKLKNLVARLEESIAPNSDPVAIIRNRLANPDGPLIA
jgi:histidyl-tRNA synthetase